MYVFLALGFTGTHAPFPYFIITPSIERDTFTGCMACTFTHFSSFAIVNAFLSIYTWRERTALKIYF